MWGLNDDFADLSKENSDLKKQVTRLKKLVELLSPFFADEVAELVRIYNETNDAAAGIVLDRLREAIKRGKTPTPPRRFDGPKHTGDHKCDLCQSWGAEMHQKGGVGISQTVWLCPACNSSQIPNE